MTRTLGTVLSKSAGPGDLCPTMTLVSGLRFCAHSSSIHRERWIRKSEP